MHGPRQSIVCVGRHPAARRDEHTTPALRELRSEMWPGGVSWRLRATCHTCDMSCKVRCATDPDVIYLHTTSLDLW